MNKTELVAAMAKEADLPRKDVEAVLKAFIDVVSEERGVRRGAGAGQ